MRLVPKAVAAVALGLVAACADSPVTPAPELVPPDALQSETVVIDGEEVEAQRPLLDVTDWDDARELIDLEVLTPEAASDIGTGSAIVITIPDEGRFGCTANFIWEARGRFYLGSAGHCFLPGSATATHGAGADYDASGVVVEVCVEDCEGNFRTNLLVGRWVRLAGVAYARQQNEAGSGVGHDFGVVEVPKKIAEVIRPAMPVWGGPTGEDDLLLGEHGCHYGHGLIVGETFLTKARTGLGGVWTDEWWAGDFAGSPGDSGSGMVQCEPVVATFEGRGAIGVLTHLGVGFDTSTGGTGLILGTTLPRAIEMAREANLKLSLLLQ
ncbi:MAG: hypothetical protein ACRELD_03390 [Longimicrobiales bacterium]